MTSDKIKYTVTSSFKIYTILSAIILVAIGMSVFQSNFIYPSFLKELINNTENEAIRTGNHLKRTVLKHYSNGQIHISDETKTYLENTAVDYDLWKITLFQNAKEEGYKWNQS
jgi:hypothetical protein